MFFLAGAFCVVFTKATGFSGSGCYDSRRFFRNTPALSIRKAFFRSRYNGRPAHWNRPHDNTVRPFRDSPLFAVCSFRFSHKSPSFFRCIDSICRKKRFMCSLVKIDRHRDRIMVRQPNFALLILVNGKRAFDGGFIRKDVIDLAVILFTVAVIGGFLDRSR